MRNNAIAFHFLENQEDGTPARAPRGYKEIRVHMVFDVKLDAGFTRKAKLAADGHLIDAPASSGCIGNEG